MNFYAAYAGEVQKVIQKVAKQCMKPNTNLCRESDREEMQSCATSVLMGFVVSSLNAQSMPDETSLIFAFNARWKIWIWGQYMETKITASCLRKL